MKQFEHFEYRVKEGEYKEGEYWDLYFDTVGFAKIRLFSTNEVVKKYFPNKNGYIFINRIPINFARKLYKIVYPDVDLKNKIVVKIGPCYDISNLYAVTRSDWIKHINKNKRIIKNPLNGQCKICEKSVMYCEQVF